MLAVLRHDDRADHAAFSPDGRYVVTASEDATARLWDVGSGELIAVLRHEKDVIRAAFSPDGGRVVTASEDTTARLWRVFPNTQALIDEARHIVPRQLTSEQRRQFFLPI